MSKIALVDDHALLRNGLAGLVKKLGHEVLFEADNGKKFIERLADSPVPDIVLLDINMPEMDGYETARWIQKHQPGIKVLALSMYDNESAVIAMLKLGAKGYILKDSDPRQLKTALEDIVSKGYYYSDFISGKLLNALNKPEEEETGIRESIQLNEREKDFLRHSCTELTYKEIAEKMFVSPRTVDGYRDALFEKLHVKTRVGLVMFAIRNGLIDVNDC